MCILDVSVIRSIITRERDANLSFSYREARARSVPDLVERSMLYSVWSILQYKCVTCRLDVDSTPERCEWARRSSGGWKNAIVKCAPDSIPG
ncbi:hypothetical protein EVAR_94654_1 [Eumeta japonica]|uniref:Uncharacterized protein n=1 Tax=Eumeta variegata TaxID=151549 RepID=A0A4C1UVJ5_EUMVA|nr:hypothetical protein EVAR_94654_1 [Eumeta japonica]